jgi:hypothetical protein
MPNDIIDAIESDVTALAERDDLTADDLCLLLTKLDGIAKRTRDAKAQLENFLLTWLPTQPVKELQIGEVEYYVGPKTKRSAVRSRRRQGNLRGGGGISSKPFATP